MCALLANDEETCVSVARFFMKDYQFTTDSYRMFAAIARVCHSPVSWYSSGPTQKYMLRQIKAMDYALVSDAQRDKYFSERGSYSAQDENGNLVINDDLDIALLMLYGHILFSGTSYFYALSMPPFNGEILKSFLIESRLLFESICPRSRKSYDQSQHWSCIYSPRA